MNISQVLDNLFPFHFIIDDTFKIINSGRSAKKLFPFLNHHDNFLEHFNIIRPKIELTLDSITEHSNALFIVRDVHSAQIEIKGQVLRFSEKVIIFVFTPIVRDISIVSELDMTMDDFAIYDTTLELMFALQSTKKLLDESNALSRNLEEKVNQRTYELKMKNDEILAQNEELIQQQDQLNKHSIYADSKNKKLQKARELIHLKNKELKLYSKNLKQEVDQRTQDLTYINSELLNQNNQLEQFAFIVAHNLRAPIARILGLLNILKLEGLITDESQFYMDNILFSTLRLEEVIQDLNVILEIKKGLHHAYENVSIKEKTQKVVEMLKLQVEENNANIQINIDGDEFIYSISSYIENILYNLISNAIKYRNTDINLEVSISTERVDDMLCILIKDNGIGLDVVKNKDNIFKLYKRFHTHVEGKGIGLYLVKTQVELLGGTIEMTSEQWKGTQFKVCLKIDQFKDVKSV